MILHSDQLNQSIKMLLEFFVLILKRIKIKLYDQLKLMLVDFLQQVIFLLKAGVNMPYYYAKLAFNEEIPKLPKFDALPKGLYWIRHIDGPAILIKEGEWNSRKFV